jgi:hypothetical protein
MPYASSQRLCGHCSLNGQVIQIFLRHLILDSYQTWMVIRAYQMRSRSAKKLESRSISIALLMTLKLL